MGGLVWKKINVVGPRAVNGLNVAGYGWSGPVKSWTVLSLRHSQLNQHHCAVLLCVE